MYSFNCIIFYETSEQFAHEKIKNSSNEFDIPFDREHLAGYLNVERSALSNELGKMKREGLIDFKKNHFVINQEAFEASM